MELGISSLGFIVEYGSTRKHADLFDLVMDASYSCLKYAENNGLKVCELVLDPPDLFQGENKERFVEMVNNFSIKKQVHAPFVDVCLCSHNSAISTASVETYKETLKFCKELGVNIVTIHPGLANYLIESIKLLNQTRLVEAINSLLNSVEKLGLTVCLENMPKKTNIMLFAEEIETLFRKINKVKDRLYFTYDTSHYWTVSEDVPLLLSKMKKLIKNVHIVDNFTKDNDTHPCLGSGKIAFKSIFDQLKNLDYRGSLIIELSTVKELNKSVEFIRKLL